MCIMVCGAALWVTMLKLYLVIYPHLDDLVIHTHRTIELRHVR